jgi:hypothetical protein
MNIGKLNLEKISITIKKIIFVISVLGDSHYPFWRLLM